VNAPRRPRRRSHLSAPVVVYAGYGKTRQETVDVDTRPRALKRAQRQARDAELVRVLSSAGMN
jgi:hypothetical protein